MILVLNVINIAHSCFVVVIYDEASTLTILRIQITPSMKWILDWLWEFILVRKILWGIIDVMVWARTKENNSEKAHRIF